MSNILTDLGSAFKKVIFGEPPVKVGGDIRKDLKAQDVDIENPRNLYGFFTNELRDLKPNNLINYIEWSRKGLNFYKSLMFEEIRRKDLRIGGVCRTRKLSVAKKQWDVEFEKDVQLSDKDKEEKVKFVKDNFKRIKFTQFITDCVEAQIQGVSTFEIDYDVFDGHIGFKQIRYIPNHVLLYNDLTDTYHYLAKEKADLFVLLQYVANSAQDRIKVMELAISDPNPLKILEVHSLDGTAQNGFQNGITDALMFAFLFKSYGIKDWHTFIERFATPAVVGKFDPLMNKEEKVSFFNAIKNWGRNFKLFIPNTAQIDLLKDQSGGSTSQIFKENQAYWNEEIAIGVIGNPLTVNVGDVGSLASSKVADIVRNDIIDSDVKVVTGAGDELIDRLWFLNFPPGTPQPHTVFPEAMNMDFQEKRSRVIYNLRQSGFQAEAEAIEDEFGFKVREVPVPGQPYEEQSPEGSEEQTPEEKKSEEQTVEEKKFTEDWIDKFLKKIVSGVKK